MRFKIVIPAILLALIGLDWTLARQADRTVRPNNAEIKARLETAKLIENGGYVQACEFERVYWLYAYQTCFFHFSGSGSFEFVYHKPKMLALGYGFGWGDAEGSYYFKERHFGERLATIRNGVIVQEQVIAD